MKPLSVHTSPTTHCLFSSSLLIHYSTMSDVPTLISQLANQLQSPPLDIIHQLYQRSQLVSGCSQIVESGGIEVLLQTLPSENSRPASLAVLANVCALFSPHDSLFTLLLRAMHDFIVASDSGEVERCQAYRGLWQIAEKGNLVVSEALLPRLVHDTCAEFEGYRQLSAGLCSSLVGDTQFVSLWLPFAPHLLQGMLSRTNSDDTLALQLSVLEQGIKHSSFRSWLSTQDTLLKWLGDIIMSSKYGLLRPTCVVFTSLLHQRPELVPQFKGLFPHVEELIVAATASVSSTSVNEDSIPALCHLVITLFKDVVVSNVINKSLSRYLEELDADAHNIAAILLEKRKRHQRGMHFHANRGKVCVLRMVAPIMTICLLRRQHPVDNDKIVSYILNWFLTDNLIPSSQRKLLINVGLKMLLIFPKTHVVEPSLLNSLTSCLMSFIRRKDDSIVSRGLLYRAVASFPQLSLPDDAIDICLETALDPNLMVENSMFPLAVIHTIILDRPEKSHHILAYLNSHPRDAARIVHGIESMMKVKVEEEINTMEFLREITEIETQWTV